MSSKKTSSYWKAIKILRFIKRNFLLILIFCALVITFSKYFFPSYKGKTIDYVSVEVLSGLEQKALKKYPNAYHVEIGQNKGIKNPIKSKKEFEENYATYNLIKVKDCKYYKVPVFTYSLPYLKNDAIRFLDDLSKRFRTSLLEKGIRNYRFSLTSVLRTTEDQKGLLKSNVNATPNISSHYFGLSFDLSQTMFYESGIKNPVYSYRLRNILLRALIQLQEEGKCYVLMENQTKCIHVTVIN
jgi:hypothetical protein